MQGRLSPLVDGRIQAFPWKTWREEFSLAQQHGFRLMEWTLDQHLLYENPLLTAAGQTEIKSLSRSFGLRILSLTGDCFMQVPFWKTSGAACDTLQQDFRAVVQACAAVGITMMLIPLVDNGRLENRAQEDLLVTFLESQTPLLLRSGVRVVFESDLAPKEYARFIGRLNKPSFGINYDIGNSASLGFDVDAELTAYGKRVMNVHVKDRVLGGTTVSLGQGNAQFEKVFAALARIGYAGNYILQTARATDDNHAKVLCLYRDMTANWINRHAA